jgi:plasmid stabilization system protein ParE
VKRKRLRIQSQAQQEINEAFDWYLKRNPEAADAFLTEIGTSLTQIASRPRLYPPYTRNTRRRVLAGFPYFVVFQEKEDIILVVAVAHAKRRHGYWRGRV